VTTSLTQRRRPLPARLRMHPQWVKNGLLAVAPAAAHSLTHPTFSGAPRRIVAFCCMASAIYLINDVQTLRRTASSTKHLRAIASGELSIRLALTCAAVLVIVAFAYPSCCRAVKGYY